MIEVKVHPKSRQNKVEQIGENAYEVWTTAAADKGDANAAVTRMLAKHLGIARANLKLVRGHTSRVKYFSVIV